MVVNTYVFSKNFPKLLSIIKYMASSKGTTVKELVQKLLLTRRSLSRLLQVLNDEYNIPIIKKKEGFGVIVRYILSEAFIEYFSNITLYGIKLSFDEAVMLYLITNSISFSEIGDNDNFYKIKNTFEMYRKYHKEEDCDRYKRKQ